MITSNITHSDKSNSNDGTESDKMDDENASAGGEGWQMRMMRARIKSKKSDRSNEPKAACYSEALDNEVVVLNDKRNDKVNNEIKKSIITRPTLLSKSNEDTIWNEDYDIIGGCHANGRGVIHRKISKSMDELNSVGATDEGVSYDDSYYESIKDNLLHSPHHHPPSPHQPLPSPHHRLPSSFVHPLSTPQHPPLFVKPPAPQVRIKKIERELSSNSQQVMKQESNQFAGDETDSNDKEENDKKEDGVKENGNERVDEIEKMNGVEDIDAGAFMEDSYGWGSSDNSSYNQNGKKDASEVYLEMHSSSYLKPCNDAPSSDDSKADVLSTDSNNKSNNKNNNLFRQPEDIITKNYDTYNTNNDSRYTNINDNNELTNNRQTYLTPQKEGGWNNVWEIPKSMENFNVMEVMRSLELLGMGAYGDKFKKEQVDGSLLASLDVDILVEDFAFKKFDAIKLIKFCKEGWRPKVDS